ncbi:unnamed protein product [Auanema sp. JU1783]|nr:unnamed protein product [Auanema sp. JU1783]
MLGESEDILLSSDSVVSRQDIQKLVENAFTAEDRSRVITYISTLANESLEAALPSLCVLAENVSKIDRLLLLDICYMVLFDPLSNRGARKACISCLKELTGVDKAYNDYYILLESLEEPQFHLIKPILGRWDSLLISVREGSLSWRLASIILVRSLHHTNGWIRVWGLERAIEVDSEILVNDLKFLLGTVFHHLNYIDTLWRLLERKKLSSFNETLGKLLSSIYSSQNEIGKATFVRELATALNSLSCPQTFYYISSIVAEIEWEAVLNYEDLPLIRSVMNKSHYIAMLSLRIITEFLLLKFFVKATKWEAQTKLDFGVIAAILGRDSRTAFQELSVLLIESWKALDYDPNVPLQYVLSKNIEDDDDCFSLLWIDAIANGKTSYLLSLISLEISERLSMTIPDPSVDNLINLLVNIPSSSSEYLPQDNELQLEKEVDKTLIASINGYILMRLTVAEGKNSDFLTLKKVYIPFLKRFSPWTLDMFVSALHLANNEEASISSERTAMLLVIFDSFLDEASSNDEPTYALIKKYVGKSFLLGPRMRRSQTSGLNPKEFNQIVAWTHSASLKLYQRFEKLIKPNATETVEEAIDVLDAAASYEVKHQLLDIIAKNIHEVKDSDLLIKAIRCAAQIVNEEKKSQNCLPAMAMVFKIAIRENVLNDEKAKAAVFEICLHYIELASLSTSVALVLANALNEYKAGLTPDWAPILVKLAMFGPVPRKDTKTINDSYSQIYKHTNYKFLPTTTFERLHEIAQRVRLQALLISLRFAEKSEAFAIAICQAIIKESNILDTNASRSFGMSLPHRQKTRASALLIFCIEHIQNNDTLQDVLNFCINGITDPCQQFSIKLLIEWTLARLCLRSPQVEEQFLNSNKKIAKERIGSISSWINVLVHTYRAKQNNSFAQIINLILPWTTAQNFGVRCTAIAASTLMYKSLNQDEKAKWPTVQGIIEFDLEPSGNSKRIIESLLEDFYFAHMNVQNHFDFRSVLVDIPSKTGLPADDTIPDDLILELNDSSVTSQNDDKIFQDAPSIVYNGLSKNSSCAPEMEMNELEEESESSVQSSDNALQRKIDTTGRVKKTDCSMIVVASLIDKPNNLGGLCRTSEIFGVDTLVISDKLLLQDAGFKALSMASENWQNIDAKKPQDLLSYLQELRNNGYTVIAAEQTVDSVPLHKFEFPKKCALLMGDERKGVPTNLLQCVDRTVEIEQLGQTRSLNVHVTASLFISKYVEQVILE